MVSGLLLVGLAVAVFVGFNIGGSSTSVAFGPAVGSKTLSKFGAAALMTVFAFLGGWTVGRNVLATLGGRIVPSDAFTLGVSIAVLFFIGFALFLSNYVGVPASTSMTTVGALVGLGLAEGNLNWAEMGRIVSWWLVSPLIAFWVSGVVGRYAYPYLVRWFEIDQSEGSLLVLDRSGAIPRPALGPNTTTREFVGTAAVIVISCYMAFSAGASNVPNAVAPLVGNGALSLEQGLLLGAVALGLGAFTIARRTLDTVGNDLTEMPILAALVVAVVSATVVTVLSQLGVPASFVIIATMSIVGLGWGRATRAIEPDEDDGPVSVDALTADAPDTPTVGAAGERDRPDAGAARGRDPATPTEPIQANGEGVSDPSDLFEPGRTARVIVTQNLVPTVATVAAYLLFRFVPPFA
ncbi:inorganic phosphate transporter [Halobacteriales archaeon QS_1_68_17]|nr:MAG: inorganic phosphate transporter [Halobacteriales archaeon QS_1_68_17]